MTMTSHDRNPSTKKKKEKEYQLLVVVAKIVIPDTAAVVSTNPLTTIKTDHAVVTTRTKEASTVPEGEDIALAHDLPAVMVQTSQRTTRRAVADPVLVGTASATTIAAMATDQEITPTTNQNKTKHETETENATTIAKFPAVIVTAPRIAHIARLAKRTRMICHRLRLPRLPSQVRVQP